MNRSITRLTLAALAVCLGVTMPARAQEKVVEKVPGFDATFELVKIPAGRIEIGPRGDAPAQTVEIKSIWMGVTEVTWDTYTIYAQKLDLTVEQNKAGVDADSRPSAAHGAADRGFGTDGYAAISLSAKAAEHYCKWLSKKTGKKYRLPTEAEWEYACRAGGAELKLSKEALHKMAWVAGNSNETPHPVGKKPANAFGLHDMLGNVGEWVVGMDGVMVQKGGSWYDDDEHATCAHRAPYTPEWQFGDPQEPKGTWWYTDGWHLGLRVVRED